MVDKRRSLRPTVVKQNRCRGRRRNGLAEKAGKGGHTVEGYDRTLHRPWQNGFMKVA